MAELLNKDNFVLADKSTELRAVIETVDISTLLRSKLQHLPIKARIRLVLGPAVFTLSVGYVSYLFYRLRRNRHPDSHKPLMLATVGSIVGANVIVYLLWQGVSSTNSQEFLRNYMMANVFSSSSALSMLGGLFSHRNEQHLLFNMAALLPVCMTPIDPFEFLHVYITGGLVGTLGMYAYSVVYSDPLFGVGASASILATAGYCLIKYYSKTSVTTSLFQIACSDILGLILGESPLSAHTAHLAGLGFGLFYGRFRALEDE